MADLTIKATRQEVADIMRRLVAGLGGSGDPYGVNQGLQLRLGSKLLSQIDQAFRTKSKGGIGEDGISWPDIKPETKAYSRRHTREDYKEKWGDVKFYMGKADKSKKSKLLAVKVWARSPSGKKILETASKARPSLSKTGDKTWRDTFTKVKARLMVKFGMSDAEASARASGAAWNAAKGSGEITKLQAFGYEKVDILRDTGKLVRSLSPGIDGQPGPEGIMRTPPGSVIVGTREKAYHHFGNAKRGLPARHFWPPDGNLPEIWWEGLKLALQRGIGEAVVMILSRAG